MFKNKGMPRFFRLIGIGLFFLILIRLDMGKLFSALSEVSHQYLPLIVLVSVAIIGIKSLRWFTLVRQQDIPLTFKDALSIYCIGNLVGAVSPGRLGELVKVYYINKRVGACDTTGAVVSVVADRGLDVVTMFLVAVIGIVLVFSGNIMMFVSTLLILIAAGAVVYALRRKSVDFLVRVVNFAVSKCVKGQEGLQTEHVLNVLRKLKKKSIWVALGWHVLAWVLFYYLISVIASACGIWVGFWALAVATSSAMILSMIPITIAGVGIRDLTIISFFSRAGVSEELAVLYSFMYLSVFLLIPAIIGLFCFILNGSSWNREKGLFKQT